MTILVSTVLSSDVQKLY